jgi:hypothetical protein
MMAELALIFSFLSPFLLAGLLFVSRDFFGAWVKARAEHGFNETIERLRGEIGASEARLNAGLQAKQKELDALRDASLSPVMSRRIALDARRLQAAEQLWNYVQDLGSLKAASSMMSIIKYEAFAKGAASKPELRQAFSNLFKISSDNPPGKDAARLRPFVSNGMWAYFSALQSILMLALMKWKMIEIGVEDPMKYMTPGGVDKIVIAALPHQEQYVKQFGAAGHYHLIEELEERFLTEMNNMLEGKSSDAATVAIVDNVLKEVGEVQRKAQEAAAKAVETET